MKKTILIISTLFLALLANAQDAKNFIDQPYIEVNGTAELEIIPDEIYLSITINEKDDKGKQQVEEQQRKMVNALSKLGIDTKKSLSALDFTSDFQNHWIKKAEIKNSKSFQLIVNSGQMLDKVYVELGKIGVSNISIIKTDHSKIEEYKQKVKVDAIKAAKVKAQALAQAIGQDAGKAIYIQEQNYMPYRPRIMNKSLNADETTVTAYGTNQMPKIEFTTIKVEANIFVRFILL